MRARQRNISNEVFMGLRGFLQYRERRQSTIFDDRKKSRARVRAGTALDGGRGRKARMVQHVHRPLTSGKKVVSSSSKTTLFCTFLTF